ncbi:MAG TPA: S8 family serine peptidase [Bryobacteraceae bacterium]|nr:S8 family serine peptidase [Bryobacteraceae bacterium]
MKSFSPILVLSFFCLCSDAWSQTAPGRYAIFLSDEPLATHFASREQMQSAAGAAWRARIATAQNSLRSELAARNIRVTGSASTLLNTVFVVAPASRVAELQALPGVAGVVRLRRRKMLLNRATTIMDGPQAWNLVGGIGNAGAGIKIGILDTGIDQTHPSLQDSSLQIPAGFPKCDTPSNCTNFTNSKVIVARSYVAMEATGSSPSNPAADSTPDDYSARDRVGHGTAVATAAAGNTATGAVTINGMAPKAWLGSYKIAGSPSVNDSAFDDAFIQALDDAVSDGMDVVTTSFGGPAFTAPTDTGAACGNSTGVPCDPLAYAFEQAASKGTVVLAAAGNEGEGGFYGTGNYPMYNTINSPADAPSVIAVGAASNTHGFDPDVELTGAAVPANLNSIAASFTDAYSPYGAYTAKVVDPVQIGAADNLACAAYPALSLVGSFLLVERGTCNFTTKMTNAVNAGALGAIFYDNVGEALIYPSGLSSFTQPAIFIGLTDGQNLKAFIDANPGYAATINPSAIEVPISGSVILAGYSSAGPGLGTFGIKPDVLAVGGGSANGDLIYLGAQNYDPLGQVYSSNRFIAAAGSSFATPLAAGSAALVKQQHPTWTGQQIKSALMNTASQSVATDDGGFTGAQQGVNILRVGGGLVAADMAVQSNVTAVPSSISFGSNAAGTSLAKSQQVTVTNAGSSSVNLGFTVVPFAAATGTTVSVSPASLQLSPGQSSQITASLSGNLSTGGLYSGSIAISGAAVNTRIPYMFISPMAGTVNLDAVSGDQNQAIAGQIIPDYQVAFQLTDANGVPVTGSPVTFSQGSGSVPLTLTEVSANTDNYGYAYATVTIGSSTGNYIVNATGGGQSYQFEGTVSPQPVVKAGAVVNGASYTGPVAPGSYVSLFGNNLSNITDENYSPLHLPLAMDQVTVSFDAAATGSLPAVSVPGHLVYVSPTQLNVQVPWELQGYSSSQMKVTLYEYGFGNVVTVPLAAYTPAMFGTGTAAAEKLDGSIVSASNPAVRGDYIELFCNGLGPVSNQPASGDSAVATPLSQTPSQATVNIGGVNANVIFTGLAPNFPGLYQVNVQIPSGIPAGNQQITVAIGGVTSPALTLPVK